MAKDNAGSPVVSLTLEKVLEGVGKYMLRLLQLLILIILSARGGVGL